MSLWGKVKDHKLIAQLLSSGEQQENSEELVREFIDENRRVVLDLRNQVLKLSVDDQIRALRGRRLFEPAGKELESPLQPTLGEFTLESADSDTIVSASMLALKAKQFDDGLYAAVEIALQEGTGISRGKAWLLQSLVQCLSRLHSDEGVQVGPMLFAAAQLGRVDVDIPAGQRAPVERHILEFEQDALRSNPIGFYTWNERLREIFKQDRVLQQALNRKEEIEVIVRSLHSDPESRHIYENYLRLVAKLTNPFEPGQISLLPLLEGLDGGQLEMTEPEYYFFPSSRSHETDLIQRLYGDKSIPEGFSLAEEMVRRIESGTLQLTPSEESGWYDYQTWAPEGLLLPPCRKLQYTDSYRKQLKNLFKSMLALTRETHIKQLRIPPVTRARGMLDIWSRFRRIPVYIGPQLSVEPVPVYYLRRAVAYRFIRNLLLKHLGSDALGSLHRLTPEGPVEASLASELEQIGALFFGAFLTASVEAGISKDQRDREVHLQAVQYGRLSPDESHSLGMGRGEDSDHDYFLNWAKERQDPDLSRDARMMVPIFYDIEKRKTKVWVFLGWSWFALTVNFAIPPKVRIFDLLGCDVTRKHRVEYVATRYSIPYPVMAEIYVERVLDRDEFRRVCDRYQCASEILKNIDQNRIPLP